MRVCKNCGSTEFFVRDGRFACKYCRSAYVPEPVSVRVTSNTTFGVASDVEVLLQKCYADPANAKRYANRILDIDPTNKEARRFL